MAIRASRSLTVFSFSAMRLSAPRCGLLFFASRSSTCRSGRAAAGRSRGAIGSREGWGGGAGVASPEGSLGGEPAERRLDVPRELGRSLTAFGFA